MATSKQPIDSEQALIAERVSVSTKKMWKQGCLTGSN
jgi:hypothetical protein